MHTDTDILRLVDADRVYWTTREGGSEAYQIHRTRIHEMIKEGLIFECPNGCCTKDYFLTTYGKERLNDKS